MSDAERIQELEIAFLLFMALVTGEPADATPEEHANAVVHLADMCVRIKQRATK